MRTYDVVLFGATGFVGKLTAAQLAKKENSDVKVALAGRRPDALKAVKDSLGPEAADWGLITVDSADRDALKVMAESTKVVASTVGPYFDRGLPLVEECAGARTHYCDLTGEFTFIKQAHDAVHEVAETTGAKIVNSCGFDSIPSDLSVYLAAQFAKENDLGPLQSVTLRVKSLSGGLSGGTLDSMRLMIDGAREDKSLRQLLIDPYSITVNPDNESSVQQPPDVFPPQRDHTGWIAPFVMAASNTRLVRRSNSLLDHAYGKDMTYREVVSLGAHWYSPILAAGVTALTGGLFAAMAAKPVRPLVDKVLPSPGEGPSQKTMDNGHFFIRTSALTKAGAVVQVDFGGDSDPGYKGTSIMFAQSALALAQNDLPKRGGVLTPASAIADPLVNRLEAQGFTIDVRQVA